MNRFNAMEYLLERMGAENLLRELVDAMSEDEAKENFEFIDRMHDLGLYED